MLAFLTLTSADTAQGLLGSLPKRRKSISDLSLAYFLLPMKGVLVLDCCFQTPAPLAGAESQQAPTGHLHLHSNNFQQRQCLDIDNDLTDINSSFPSLTSQTLVFLISRDPLHLFF